MINFEEKKILKALGKRFTKTSSNDLVTFYLSMDNGTNKRGNVNIFPQIILVKVM